MSKLLHCVLLPSLFTIACSACGELPSFFSNNDENPKPQSSAGLTADPELISGIAPTNYAVQLHIDPQSDHYRGRIEIGLQIELASSRLVLHAEDIDLTAVTVECANGEFMPQIERHQSSVTLKFSRSLPAGSATLRASFEGRLRDDPKGIYHQKIDGENYVFTALQQDQARRAFPCFDDPQFRVPFQLTLQLPQDLPALHNAPEKKRTSGKESDTVTYEAITLPISQVAFAVGPLDLRSEEGIRIATVWGKGALSRYALKAASALNQQYRTLFQNADSKTRFNWLALPSGRQKSGGLGLKALPEAELLCDADRASFKRLRWIWQSLSRDLASLWIQGQIYMKDPQESWLLEGWSLKLAQQALSQAETSFEIERHAAASRPNRDSLDIKTAATLASIDLMAQTQGNPNATLQALRELMQNPGAKTAKDLYAALDRAAGFQTEAFFAELPQSSRPVVAFSCQNHSVTATRHNDSHVFIPVCLRDLEADKVYCDSLGSQPITFSIESCQYFPNAYATGDYNWTLPAAEFHARLKDDRLTATERASMTARLDEMLFSQALNAEAYFKTLDLMAQSGDLVMIETLLRALNTLYPIAVAEHLEDEFANRVQNLLLPELRRLEESDEPDIDALADRLHAALAHMAHREESLDEAQMLRERFLQNPLSAELDRAAMLLPESAQRETDDSHNELIRHLSQTQNPVERVGLIAMLGGDRNEKHLFDTLDFVLDGHIAPQEIPTLLAAASSPQSRALLWRYLNDHRIKLNDALGAQASQLPWWGAGLCSKKGADELQEMFPDNSATQAQIQNRERVQARILQCAERSGRLSEAFKAWLRF